MLSGNALFKRIFLIFAAILLTQCTKVAGNHLGRNQQLVSPFTMPAAAYLALAKNQAGSERQSLQLMAAGRYIYDGQWQEGQKILASLDSLPSELLREKNLLQAKIHLIRRQSKLAIASLSSISDVGTMPLYYQIQYHEMLAMAYRSTGNIMEALNERVKLERLLPDEVARSNNRRVLWLMLATLPPEELNSFAVEAADGSELDGWLQLAVIARTNPEDVHKTIRHLQQWQSHYPLHPGNRILPTPLAQVQQNLFASPQKIALLLPLTGKLSGPGNAIRDGFMQAYEGTSQTGHLEVLTYDTDKESAATLYQRAIAAGADYVVGPLGKADVAQIAGMNHPVPTLLLNETTRNVRSNAYQFGLSPVSEAKQVASRARKNGHMRALIIAPASPWGDEVVTAFTRQWQNGGGQVVDALRYAETDNMGPAIKNILRASTVVRPSREHPVVLDKKASSIDSMRRQDFDMIFMLAYPSKARQIMPMLRYYYAGNVPVYATSAVYSGNANAQQDRDLDGVQFCDMPWVFSHQMGSKNWPEQWNSYNRLYALGKDSFVLVKQLNQLLLFPAMGVSENSGVLYLSTNQQISRILAWGRFDQGLAQEVSN